MSYYEREPFDILALLQIVDQPARTPAPWPSMAQAIADATDSRERVKRIVDVERLHAYESRSRDLERLGDDNVTNWLKRLCRDANELGLSYDTFTRFWSQVCRATADAHSVAPRREEVQTKKRRARQANAAAKTLLELLDSSELIRQAAADCLDRELYNQTCALWLMVYREPERLRPALTRRGQVYVYSNQSEILRNTLHRFALALTDVEPLVPTGGQAAKAYADNLIREFLAAFGKPRLRDVFILVGVIFGPATLSLDQLQGIRREQTRRRR